MKSYKWIAVFLIISQGFLQGQKTVTDSSGRSTGWLVYPVIFYSPETRWAYGLSMMVFSRDTASIRSSSWLPVFIYTQNRQILASVKADLYGKKDKWRTSGWAGYYIYPDQFFGVGNRTTSDQKEAYTASRIIFQVSPKIQIRKGLFTGLEYDFMDQRLSDLEENGLLIRGNVPGSSHSRYSGIGGLLIHDTRDNVFFPLNGQYHRVQLTVYNKVIGSDYRFNRFEADLREYLALSKKQVFAFQFQSQMIFGTAPFQTLSSFGGSQKMRGYFEGRFRDNHALITQAEYRIFLNSFLGAVVFGGVGNVARRLDDFQTGRLKYTAGFGFRMKISPDEKLNLRVDFGYGENTSGVYVELGEAF